MLNNKKSLKFRSESFQKFHYITTVYISMILTNRGSQTVQLKYCKIILLSMRIYPSLVGSKFFPVKKCIIYLSPCNALRSAAKKSTSIRLQIYSIFGTAISNRLWSIDYWKMCLTIFFFEWMFIINSQTNLCSARSLNLSF